MNLPLLLAQASSNCTLNGQPVDCDVLADQTKGFLGFGIGLFVLFAVIAIAIFVFWVLMLLHAIKHNSPNKQTWIIILVASFFLGLQLIAAVVYYFAEKKKAEQFNGNGQNGPSQPGPQGPQAPQQPVSQPANTVAPDNNQHNQPPTTPQ